MSTFGERLHLLRKSKQLKAEGLAQIGGVKRRIIFLYEKNEAKPSYEVLMTFADYFKVSLDYLTGRDSYCQTPDAGNCAPVCVACGEEVEIHFSCGCGEDRAVFTEEELQERNAHDEANHGIITAFAP